MSFNEKGEAIDGRLQSDRPWVVKIQPAYILPWGTMAGAEIDIEAGSADDLGGHLHGRPGLRVRPQRPRQLADVTPT